MERTSLEASINNLFELYGHRNAMFLRGEMRAIFLDERVRSFFKAIRKGETSKVKLAGFLASAFSRTVAYADSFVNLPLVLALCEKYPSYGCAYCKNRPCSCETNRKGDISLAIASPDQMNWAVQEWVEHMNLVYGRGNRAAGIYFAICRLQEEIGEAKAAHHFDGIDSPDVTLSVRRLNIAREFADVFAWIFSIAGMLELDLGAAIQKRYGGNCYRCNKRPCNCGSPLMHTLRANPIDDDTVG